MAMARIVKLPVEGRDPVDALEVDFKPVSEQWDEYELADGGRVRVKTVVQRIYRIVDSEGKATRTPDGDPAVVVRHGTLIVSSD
jgi:hypothetical protein